MLATIPSQLTQLHQWVNWKYEDRGGKKTKVPYQPNGSFAQSNNPNTWHTFFECAASVANFDGVGIMFANNLVGIDLDHCIDEEGNLNEFARIVLEKIQTYTEITPSGRGLHLLFFGKLPGSRRRDDKRGIEMYDYGRYFTVTGNHYPGTPEVLHTLDVTEFYDFIFGADKDEPQITPAQFTKLDDSEIITRALSARNNEKFVALYGGDTSPSDNDHSRADLSLCSMLAFWTGKDAAQMDRLFRSSGLMRDKWDEKHGATTYGAMTIERAIANTQDVYKPNTPRDGGEWLRIDAIIDALGRAETGDAEILSALYADKIAYDHAEDKWFFFRGHSWAEDRTGEVVGLVQNQVAAQYLQAAAIKKRQGNTEMSEALTQRAKGLRFKSKIMNVLTLAQSDRKLALSGDEWDAKAMTLAVGNGVIDLSTGQLSDGKPKDYLRVHSDTHWRGIDEPAPRWEQFLNEIFAGDKELVSFVQRLFGYAITGAANEHIFPVLYGEGRNGKNVMIETIAYVLGSDICAPVASDVLIDQGKRNAESATPNLYSLRGKRVVWVDETNEGAKLNAPQVKNLTGSETIVARPLHGATVTFKRRYTMALMTNHKPRANADDFALWQRLILIPFSQRFVENPVAPNEHPRDTKLTEKLRAESSGILAWLVRGCLDWQSNGLQAPKTVKAATDEYQDDEDEIGHFITARCYVDKSNIMLHVKASELYEEYKLWSGEEGTYTMSQTKFGTRMAKRFVKSIDPQSYGRIYSGIGLLHKGS